MLKSPTAAWLFVEQGARAGASLRLEGKPAMLGRDPEADLQMDTHQDLMASGRHARVSPSVRGWEVRDLGSRNGTWVNGEELRGQRVLEPGDRIRLGKKGPLVLFTDRPPEELVARRRRPRTIAGGGATPAGAPSGPGRGIVIGLVVAVMALAAAVAFWAGRALTSSPDPPGPSVASTPDRTPLDDPGPPASGTGALDDTAAARRDAEIDALEQEIATIREALQRSERESDRLRETLAEARRGGASAAEVDSLADMLRRSNAARQRAEADLRVRQMAGSIPDAVVARIRRQSLPAIAQVFVEFGDRGTFAATAFGVDPGGRLVTNKHVVQRSGARPTRIAVQYAGQETGLRAAVVGVSRAFDVAVLEVIEPAEDLPSITAFNTRADTLSVPAPVVLMGFPLGGEGGPGSGVARPLVSASVLIGRGADALELEGYGRVGASGSPIFDAEGSVVGLLMGGETTGGGERLYALPASRIVSYLELVLDGFRG